MHSSLTSLWCIVSLTPYTLHTCPPHPSSFSTDSLTPRYLLTHPILNVFFTKLLLFRRCILSYLLFSLITFLSLCLLISIYLSISPPSCLSRSNHTSKFSIIVLFLHLFPHLCLYHLCNPNTSLLSLNTTQPLTTHFIQIAIPTTKRKETGKGKEKWNE